MEDGGIVSAGVVDAVFYSFSLQESPSWFYFSTLEKKSCLFVCLSVICLLFIISFKPWKVLGGTIVYK